ncbi:UDP-glycosyltransferase 91C1-like [Arachis stenosperma]|uniref:UDP-glycosyltransferase 91C1-like n=1 Tax=Arachis stenosperma TaxID=217475 RepID=UPI0025AD549A|nr:UDP-glycosyltransferase 91C1-like [Arachis stenosperma]
MENPVKESVSKLQPDWIIFYFHPHWIVEIAQELHVKLMYYSVYSASTIVFFGPPGPLRAPTSPEVLTSLGEWVNFPSSVAFQRNEAIAFYQDAYIENVTELRGVDRLASVIDAANALSFRSCYEMEGEYLNL